ncbi:MAG: GNAT family N-acetyltransferase [Anaerolineae bacterium]|nr:GNAT family N-acetyltransferase [Anaerolineae bacterium]
MNSTPWQERYADKLMTARDALRVIKRGQTVFVGSGASGPQVLVEEMAKWSDDYADLKVVHLLTLIPAPYTEPNFKHQFRHNAFFVGDNVREAVAEGRADYTPIYLSEIPSLFRSGRLHIDVALIQVTPPDAHGFCSFGVSVDIVKAAAETADYVIAGVNPQMPWTWGDSVIHVDQIDALVENDAPLPEFRYPEPDEVTGKIGENVASLIEHGSTLQLGIGTVPAHVLPYLKDKRDLGIHTEMLTDAILDLIEAGVVTNARKTLHRGKAVISFCVGTRRLYDFVDRNPFFEFHPSDYVNDPFVISRNDRMVAINSALEVDLTGQVCADSVGYFFYSGIGGQVDFIRGAARSRRGQPIIVLPSTAKDGTVSRIVSHLSEGAGVVTTRGDVHYVVTEYGIADLYGKNIRERALALIHIAHPKFREELLEQAKLRHYVFVDQVPPLGVYPAELETYVTLRAGIKIFFRPIKPTDEAMMQELFYSLSEESIYYRFFHRTPFMPHKKVQRFTTIDYQKEMAIVGVVEEYGREKIIAVGRYSLEPESNMAEVALLVHDDWQGRGIGTWLLKYLIQIAKSRKIAGFKAQIMADNQVPLRMTHKTGYTVETTLDNGVFLVSFKFQEKGEPKSEIVERKESR